MDERTLSLAGTLSLDAARRVDQRCAQFEARLRQGEQPAIEAFLDLPSGPEQRASLRELLVLELEYRRQRGEQPDLADYQSRFADDADVVADAFASRLASATSTQTFAAGSETADHDPAVRPLRTATSGDVLPRSFGPYLLECEIARGGMGIVYQAKRADSDRPLALKMVLSGAVASREEIVRFRREAEAAAQLDHPHIVPIYEIGEAEGHVYFTMALVQGESLADRLKRGPMTPREAAYFVLQIAEAVQFAHARGIVHRDLKPGNVLIDRAGNVLVTDFGLAKRLDGAVMEAEPEEQPRRLLDAAIRPADLTRTGTVLGTPAYMAPEQATGAKHVGPPADIYSLGVILYALLTGRPPFLAASLGELIDQLLHRAPLPPAEINRQVDRTLDAICLRCLAKAPEERYSTAGELAEHLRSYVSGQKVRLPGSTLVDRTARYLNENPALLPITTGLLLRPWLGWTEAMFTITCLAGMATSGQLRLPRRWPIVLMVCIAVACTWLAYAERLLPVENAQPLAQSVRSGGFALGAACGCMVLFVLGCGWSALRGPVTSPVPSSAKWYRFGLLIVALAAFVLPPLAALRAWLAGPGYGGSWSNWFADWGTIVVQLTLFTALPLVLGAAVGVLASVAAHRLLRATRLDDRQLISLQMGAALAGIGFTLALWLLVPEADPLPLRGPCVGRVVALSGMLVQAWRADLRPSELMPVVTLIATVLLAASLFLGGLFALTVALTLRRTAR